MSFNKAKEAHEKLMSERKELPVNNKYQEGLSNFSNLIFVSELSEYARKKMLQSLNDLKKLVDKETPMKPKEEDGLLLCGKCENNTIALSGYSGEEWCCYACGRVIDWSVEE